MFLGDKYVPRLLRSRFVDFIWIYTNDYVYSRSVNDRIKKVFGRHSCRVYLNDYVTFNFGFKIISLLYVMVIFK